MCCCNSVNVTVCDLPEITRLENGRLGIRTNIPSSYARSIVPWQQGTDPCQDAGTPEEEAILHS